MATITIDIPDSKATDLSKYVTKIGGKVMVKKQKETSDEDDEVTHGVFFGENIRRVIKAFRKS